MAVLFAQSRFEGEFDVLAFYGYRQRLLLHDYVLDNGLSTLATANKIYMCSLEPTNYTEATSTFALGLYDFGGAAFGSVVASSTPVGRKISSNAIFNGTATGNGVAAYFAAVDSNNSRLLANGSVTTPKTLSAGGFFSLPAFSITLPNG